MQDTLSFKCLKKTTYIKFFQRVVIKILILQKANQQSNGGRACNTIHDIPSTIKGETRKGEGGGEKENCYSVGKDRVLPVDQKCLAIPKRNKANGTRSNIYKQASTQIENPSSEYMQMKPSSGEEAVLMVPRSRRTEDLTESCFHSYTRAVSLFILLFSVNQKGAVLRIAGTEKKSNKSPNYSQPRR